MIWKIVEILAGTLIVLATVMDVFGTVVVPGRVRIGLHLPRLVQKSLLAGWRHGASWVSGGRQATLTSAFAALLLFVVFTSWLLLMALGFGLVIHALRDSFRPPLSGFAEALFQTGSAMMTLGLNGPRATGWARLPVVLSGIGGLQVITVTLTYIVQLQMALQERDPLVLRLESHAGAPPSGLQLLLNHKLLGLENDLSRLFERWEEWSAQLRQTHGAHPVLIYFRSGEPHVDWVAALGAMLDAASLVLAAIEDGPKGNAELLRRGGMQAVQQLAKLLDLPESERVVIDPLEAKEALARLREAGFAIGEPDKAEAEIVRLRRSYAGTIAALAAYFGVEAPPFVPSGRLEPS